MADAIGFSWKASKNGLTNLTNDNVTELDTNPFCILTDGSITPKYNPEDFLR
jgi:hypothetical protein